jgi:hypothetical protein
MKPVVVELEIERPAEVVWEYMENAEHNPSRLEHDLPVGVPLLELSKCLAHLL